MAETINAPEVYLFGYPLQASLKISDTETVDVTHAVKYDREANNVTLDPSIVLDAIDAALRRGFGVRSAYNPLSSEAE